MCHNEPGWRRRQIVSAPARIKMPLRTLARNSLMLLVRLRRLRWACARHDFLSLCAVRAAATRRCASSAARS